MILGPILLGIVEGVTEFLPISSTGHLLIAGHWLGSRSDTFNAVIQAGAMLAVTLVYWRRLMALITEPRKSESRAYGAKLLLAFGITAALGFVAKRLGVALPETVTPVAWALVLGVWMLAAEWLASRFSERSEVTWTVAMASALHPVAPIYRIWRIPDHSWRHLIIDSGHIGTTRWDNFA